MTSSKTDVNSDKIPETTRKIPDWVTEDYFVDVLKENVEGFKKIVNFNAGLATAEGENYASIMMRIKIKVALEDGSIKDVSYMMKTIPPSKGSQAMINGMGLFPKELAMYGKYIPEFEQIYRDVGKHVTFGPKSYRFKKDPGVPYVLLEDISPKGFVNGNRLEGLDIVHVKSVLELLAAFHAVSVVKNEIKDDETFKGGALGEEQREMLVNMTKGVGGIFIECLQTYDIGRKYTSQIKKVQDSTLDRLINFSSADENEFNVILHGDLWVNNIMFRNNGEGKPEDTIFIDFQICRYGTPSTDLIYFLLSSTKLDLKVSHFDYFVKYYYVHLVENLILLNYQNVIPTYKELVLSILKNSYFAYTTISNVMGPILLDPSKNANLDNLFHIDGDGREFKKRMFTNQRFVKHMETIIPWLDVRGMLE